MQTDHGISQKGSELPIVEIDDFDIDGLGFKPVNKGLGFHGEREIKSQKRSNSTNTKRIDKSFSTLSTRETRLQHISENVPLQGPMQGIEHFYNTKESLRSLSKEEPQVTKSDTASVDAKLLSRLLAFVIDCGVVATTSLFVFGLFVLTLYSAVGKSLIQTFVYENLDFFLLLSGVIYIIYFTLWDGVGTLGKILLKIGVSSIEKEETLTMTQLFNRSVLSLFGMFFIFLPNILDLHTKLSRTKTIDVR